MNKWRAVDVPRLAILATLAISRAVISAVAIGITAVLLFELKSSMLEGRKLKLQALVESSVNVAVIVLN